MERTNVRKRLKKRKTPAGKGNAKPPYFYVSLFIGLVAVLLYYFLALPSSVTPTTDHQHRSQNIDIVTPPADEPQADVPQQKEEEQQEPQEPLSELDRQRAEVEKLQQQLTGEQDAVQQAQLQQQIADQSYAIAATLMTEKNGDVVEITDRLRAVVAFNPSHRSAKHWLALQLSKQPHNTKESAELLRSINIADLEGTGVNPLDTFMLLGQAEDRLGNLEASVEAFHQAIQLYMPQSIAAASQGQQLPPHIDYRFALAAAQYAKKLYQVGRIDDAKQFLNGALDNPSWAGQVFQLHDIFGLVQVRKYFFNLTSCPLSS